MTTNTNGLMKKTKKELVDVILRKDDVERKLSEEITRLTDDREALKDQCKIVNTKVANLKLENSVLNQQVEEFKKVHDEYASNIQELMSSRFNWRFVALLSLVTLMVSLIFHIIV